MLRLTLGGIVLVVLLQIVGRLSDRPVSWTEELTRALFIWMIFIGMAACLGFFALMAWTGVNMVRQQVAMNETIATLGWPAWVIGAVIPVSGLIAIACTLASLRDRRDIIAADQEVVS